MKCGALLVLAERRRKGSSTPYEAIVQVIAAEHVYNAAAALVVYGVEECEKFRWGKLDLKEGRREICDGTIEAHVWVEDEPYFGGTNAVFRADFRCTRCKNTWFKGLPADEDDISKLLTKAIADKEELSPMQRSKLQ